MVPPSELWRRPTDQPVVLAFGGNALLPGGAPDGEDERRAEELAAALLQLLPDRAGLVLVHGNGPQVGNILLRVEATRDRIPPESLDVLVAETQGSMGYLLAKALRNVTQQRQHRIEIATVGTQVVVDADDPAFDNPSKPIGPFYSQREAETLAAEKRWTVVPTEHGWRRVVASPRPREIVEYHTIAGAVAEHRVVIAGGGGGIPVVRSGWGELRGVEAVIDKDRTAALVATSIAAAGFVILTAVPSVYLHFNTPRQERLARITPIEARRLIADGAFPPGSMGPKIEAAADYVEALGIPALITSVEALPAALAGDSGTWIVT